MFSVLFVLLLIIVDVIGGGGVGGIGVWVVGGDFMGVGSERCWCWF